MGPLGFSGFPEFSRFFKILRILWTFKIYESHYSRDGPAAERKLFMWGDAEGLWNMRLGDAIYNFETLDPRRSCPRSCPLSVGRPKKWQRSTSLREKEYGRGRRIELHRWRGSGGNPPAIRRNPAAIRRHFPPMARSFSTAAASLPGTVPFYSQNVIWDVLTP